MKTLLQKIETSFLSILIICVAWSAPRALFAAKSDWHVPFPPFKIAGNLYYVGTADLAAYLIQTPEGIILINSNMPEDLPLLKESIAKLGFNYGDIKILLLSHAHYDHDQAAGTIKKETGARLMVMEADVRSASVLFLVRRLSCLPVAVSSAK